MEKPHDLIPELSHLALSRVVRLDVPDVVLGQVVDGLFNVEERFCISQHFVLLFDIFSF